MSSRHVLLFKSVSLSLSWRIWSFVVVFSLWVWNILLNFLLIFLPNSYLFQKWYGSWKSEHWMILPLLDSNTFRNNTSPKGPHLQREHFIRAAKTGKGLGWEMWVFFSIPYSLYANWSLICLSWIRGSSAWSTGAKVTSQRSLWSSGSTAVHKNCSNICSIKVHMVSIFFTVLLLLLCLCTNLPDSEFLLCWAPSATELGVGWG